MIAWSRADVITGVFSFVIDMLILYGLCEFYYRLTSRASLSRVGWALLLVQQAEGLVFLATGLWVCSLGWWKCGGPVAVLGASFFVYPLMRRAKLETIAEISDQ